MSERKSIPLQTRLAAVSSIDVEARTAELLWTTGAQVRRTDWWTGKRYLEELSLDPKHVDMTRLNTGAPLLDAHSNWSLDDVIGVVESASVDGKEGRAKVRFSKRDSVNDVFRDVQDGILRNVSVGYAVRKYEITEREGELPIYRAVDWEPMELSLVPIGADPGAGVRGEEVDQARSFPCEFINAAQTAEPFERGLNMTQEVKQGAADSATVVDVEAEKRAAVEAERVRIADIQTACRIAKMPEADTRKWISDGTSIDQVRKQIFDKLATEGEKTPTRNLHIETLQDETETRREAAALALKHRYAPSKELREDARQYRGMSLLDIARECVERDGVRTRGMDKMEVSKRAMAGTSDFPYILANVANKTLRAGYESSPRTFTRWARTTTAADFKQISRVNLGDAPSFEVVNEGGEFKRGVMKEAREVYQLATYGKIVAITRQAIVNDDLSAFTRIPELMGRAAADLESDTVYSVLTANAALADAIALFHASHNNLTGTGTVISVASLDVGRALMRVQKNLENRPINLMPSFLIVPASRETIANQYTSADFVSAKSSDINPFKGALEVVVEARLDANSATAWYLAASPSQCDTVEYAYLEGNEGVYLETRTGFDVDGMEIKGRLDFAAKAIDFRGLYKNNGA